MTKYQRYIFLWYFIQGAAGVYLSPNEWREMERTYGITKEEIVLQIQIMFNDAETIGPLLMARGAR